MKEKESAINVTMGKTLALLFVLASCALFVSCGATATKQPAVSRALSELSGVLHRHEKAIERYYLVLDGSRENCNVHIKAPTRKDREAIKAMIGKRVYVKGILKSYLYDNKNDYTVPGSPAPSPFQKGWLVRLDVKDLQTIEQPFGTPRQDNAQ